ncbi:MAG: LysM peptidoglycan-binding domain-containing protein, partial [Gallionella sp.]|nr:LysM peptidoglycan-binding domain-containing protein [Gallionella sp.]
MKQARIGMLLVIAALAGCSSSANRAPIVDRNETGNKSEALKKSAAAIEPAPKKIAHENDWRPEVHVVQKGDTLYSIAFNYGFAYRELAELNGIKDPSLISIGQEIRLFPNRQNTAGSAAAVKAVEPPIKEQPKLAKYAYSETAVVKIEKIQAAPQPQPAEVAKTAKPVAAPPVVASADADDNEEAALDWSMPAQGKLIAGFSESANRKGIDIAGKLGQPILASAPGKVVYSGSGLRGYGKLVIIKHNK